MNLEYTREQFALGDSVRRFLATVAESDPWLPPKDSVDTSGVVWRGLAELGVTGLIIPEEFGGGAGTMVDAGVVLGELGRALDCGPWLSSAIAAPRALARIGVSDEAAELLSGIADGSVIATLGLHRAHAPVVVATRNGNTVTLSGTTADMPDASVAGVLLVPARDGDRNALFAVETAAPGVAVVAAPSADRTRGRSHVTYAGTPARWLGELPERVLDAVIDDVLIAAAADAAGAAERILELTVAHAKARKQFGRPIGAFQAVQHLCVDMLETVELARGGVMHGLWAADAATDEQRHLSALRVNAFSGRLATVGDTAIQIFGGIGYTWEHEAHFYLERLLHWSTFLGGPDRYLREIGAHVVRVARPSADVVGA
ncbi:acyl-CoA dehydrogenase family protein [Nocardia sp. NPDC005366]|uniref:acyl-CoA dehydrogenase family protein n=1 Tax=Nocardia sp. NPDC005366 TaxID=3156878 RepID=UPI0033B303F3